VFRSATTIGGTTDRFSKGMIGMNALNTDIQKKIITIQIINNHITVQEAAKITGYNI
jgi:hypothetical protein